MTAKKTETRGKRKTRKVMSQKPKEGCFKEEVVIYTELC